MLSSKRKANTAEFTSALKQVFHIHKHVVAELYAQLDVVTDECRLLKANSHNSKSSNKCESCIHLEKMNMSLQEHFNSLLHEKDISLKELEKKLQVLTGQADSISSNTNSSQIQRGKVLPKEGSCTVTKQEVWPIRNHAVSPEHHTGCNDVCALPLELTIQEGKANLSKTESLKSHSRLRLAREGKRYSCYVEEQRKAKRVKVSPVASAKNDSFSSDKLGLEENSFSELDETVFVPETVFDTQSNIRSAFQNVDNEIGNVQSQEILVVPETLAIDNSSNSGCEHEANTEKEEDDKDGNKIQEPVVVSDRHHNLEDADRFLDTTDDKESILSESVTLVNDDDDDDSHNTQDIGDENECSVPGQKHDENECLVPGQKHDESKMKLSNKPVTIFQKQDHYERTSQPSHGGQQVGIGKVQRSIQDSVSEVNVKKGKLNVNGERFFKEGSAHHVEVMNPDASQNVSSIKQNCHILRKNSVFIKNTTNQKESETANSVLKMKSLNQDHNVVFMKETVTPHTVHRTSSQAVTGKERLKDISETAYQRKDGETLRIEEAIQRSFIGIEKSEEKSLKSDHHASVSSSTDSIKINCEFKSSSTTGTKEAVRKELENPANMSQFLPVPSKATSVLKIQECEASVETRELTAPRTQSLNSTNTNPKNKVFILNSPEPNGSLNPEIRLTEYLDLEITDKSKVNQTFCALDETIAPNLISQCLSGPQLNVDSSQMRANMDHDRTCHVQQIADESHINVDDNWEDDGDENILSNVNIDDNWHEDDDDVIIMNSSVFLNDEDDFETIGPSPQHISHTRSQLYSSIPASSSSFKFVQKKPQLTNKSVQQGTGESKIVKSDDSLMEHMAHDKSHMDLNRSTKQQMYNSTIETCLDNFDRVPKPETTEFPHVSVVRKRDERNKLEGFSCKQCYEYYKNSGLSEEALQQKKNECSRHRERYRAPETPEHFWSLGFPDTAEIIERRQKHDSMKSPVAGHKAPRRRKRLEQRF